MKRLIKVVLALFIFLLFVGTVGLLGGLIEIPWVSGEVNWLLLNYPWLISFFKGILIILGGLLFICLVVVLSVSGGRKRLVIKDGKNRIEILKSTVEQVAEEAFNSTVHPDKTKMKVKIKGKAKVVIHLRIDVLSKVRFQPIADEIKEQMQTALTTALEPIENQVSIHLREQEPTKTSTFGKKQSRVI